MGLSIQELLELADMRQRVGDHQEARRLYAHILAVSRSQHVALARLGTLEMGAGHPNAA